MTTHTFYKTTTIFLVTLFVVVLEVTHLWAQEEKEKNMPQKTNLSIASKERIEYYWDYRWPWFFQDYKTWTWGAYPTEATNDDMRCIFETILRNEGDIPPYYHFVDINSDSLIDLMYYRPLSNSAGSHISSQYAILINKGNDNFETAYKCIIIDTDGSYKDGYYGDCASNIEPTSSGCNFPGSYTQWPQNKEVKNDDYLRHALQFINNDTDDTFAKYQFLDMNGDGLNDIFYGDYYKNENNQTVQYTSALFLNTGNNNFDLSYKCVEYHSRNNPNDDVYYGDCAAE